MTFDKPDHEPGDGPDKSGHPEFTHTARQLSNGELIIGRYKVISLIGQGAVGSVYAVEQVFLQKRFALKTLNPIARPPESGADNRLWFD
jgi:serine/threonine protein kinase